MGLTLPSRPARSTTLSWYNLEEHALASASPRQSASMTSIPSCAATDVIQRRSTLLPSHPSPAYSYNTPTNAQSTSSLSCTSSVHSALTENGCPAIDRGSCARLPHALSTPSHAPSRPPRVALSVRRKPAPSLDSISFRSGNSGLRPSPVNTTAWLPKPVHIVGPERSFHSFTPSIHKISVSSSRQEDASVDPRRRRHPPSLTPGCWR